MYTITDKKAVPKDGPGKTGIDRADMIQRTCPDYKHRIFYISGTYSMVTDMTKCCAGLGIADGQVKTDFFPGFA